MALLPTAPVDSAADVRASRFDALVQEYGQLLRSTITRLCPPHLGLNTSDIEQDATLRVWQLLRSEKEIENPASYLYRIAATATIDAVRRVKRRREEQLRLEGEERDVAPTPLRPDLERSPDALFRRREIVAKVRDAMSKLADNRRRAVGLYLQGMTTEEIGRFTGWTEAKARNLVYRGLADLRAELRAMGVDVESH